MQNREELIREIFKNPEDCDDVTILVQSSVKNTAAVRDDLASKKYFTVQGDTETAVVRSKKKKQSIINVHDIYIFRSFPANSRSLRHQGELDE